MNSYIYKHTCLIKDKSDIGQTFRLYKKGVR